MPAKMTVLRKVLLTDALGYFTAIFKHNCFSKSMRIIRDVRRV